MFPTQEHCGLPESSGRGNLSINPFTIFFKFPELPNSIQHICLNVQLHRLSKEIPSFCFGLLSKYFNTTAKYLLAPCPSTEIIQVHNTTCPPAKPACLMASVFHYVGAGSVICFTWDSECWSVQFVIIKIINKAARSKILHHGRCEHRTLTVLD